MSNGPLALRHSKYSDSKERYKEEYIKILLPRDINGITIEQIAKIRTDTFIRELDNLNSLVDKLFEKNFIFVDRADILKEIFDINNALSSIIKNKLGRTAIMVNMGYILSLYEPTFLMSEALNYIASNALDSYASQHTPIRIREGNSALRIITSFNDL